MTSCEVGCRLSDLGRGLRHGGSAQCVVMTPSIAPRPAATRSKVGARQLDLNHSEVEESAGASATYASRRTW
jgi:hypothetical protein